MILNFIKFLSGGWYCSSCKKYHGRNKQKYLKRTPAAAVNNNLTYEITYSCKN